MTVKNIIYTKIDTEYVTNTVRFVRYSKGYLWYIVCENNYEFPVPITDTGDGIFNAVDKASLFMRYIRQHMETTNEH